EDKGHSKHSFPEINGGLAVGTGESDVMHALTLQFLHGISPRELMLDQFRLVFTTLQAAVRHKFDTGCKYQDAAQPGADGFGQSCILQLAIGKFYFNGKRWFLFYTSVRRFYQNVTANFGCKFTD